MDAYFDHGRVIAGTLAEHTTAIATEWIAHHANGDTVAITTCANEHVDAINRAIQTARIDAGHLDPQFAVAIGGREHAHPGDVVATRRNDRRLDTDIGEPVRSRELWTVAATHPDGALTVTHLSGHGTVTLPADYTRHHVRLGYAATEHGNQSDTPDPLYRCRRLLVMAAERISDDRHERLRGLLAAGDPKGELRPTWHAKEVVRQIYDHTDADIAAAWVDDIGRDFTDTSMPLEVRRVGRTIKRWRDQIVAWHHAHVSNGPTEAVNNLVKRVKRVAFGFIRFRNYRLRALLYAGKPNWTLLDAITPP